MDCKAYYLYIQNIEILFSKHFMSETMNKDGEILRLKKEIKKLKKNIKKQRYGLVWVDIQEAFEDDVENKIPILKEIPKLEIKSKDNKLQHILIEGDNYHALTCLNYTHKGKIDVIYIDPPYNTGNDDFKYKDKRILDIYPDGTSVPKDSPYRHSYWLSFMSKRLELAKSLLKEDGVIFINIDDNEFAQLKLLCDSIFYEENHVANYIWESRSGKGATAKQVASLHEYVLCYSKNYTKIKLKQDVRKTMGGNFKDEKGKYKREQLRQWGQGDRREDRPTMFYAVKTMTGRKIYPIKDDESEGRWRVSEKTMLDLIKKNDVDFVLNDKKYQLYRKVREGKITKTAIGTLLYGLGTASTGTIELKEIFGKKVFDTTKPLRLINFLISLNENKNALVLDFFAGSGTTGHSVLSLNHADNGSRQFILVNNNNEITNGKKHKIMSGICRKRIQKVMKGYFNKKGLGGSAKYFKTSFIGRNNILFSDDKDKIELACNAGELLAIAEDTLNTEKINEYYQIFKAKNEEKYTAVYFREELDQFNEFVKDVLKIKVDIVVYIFSWEEFEEIEEFEDCKNIKIKTIPKPILEIYKQIYNLT